MRSVRLPDGAARGPVVVLVAALCALAGALVATAWLADDSFFTLRTVQQLLLGRGPRWNAFERVQAYTHPLWMLVLGGAIGITREYYFTTLAVSLATSAAAVAWLLRLAPTAVARIAVALLLLGSRAFVDWSTGGLENPLGHLLAAAALATAIRDDPGARGVFRASLVTALAALNRLDAVLLFLPLVVVRVAALRRAALSVRVMAALAAGFLPLVAWLAFAAVYYGTPFPNTALAKLGAGIPAGWLAEHGLVYLRECLRRDPVTGLGIAAGVALALARPFPGARALAAGILLHLAYLVRVGGDFMLGRFLSVPFLVAVGLLALRPWRAPRAALLAGAAALAIGLAVPLHRPGLLRAWEPRPDVVAGVGDERARYFCGTGLLRAKGRLRPLTRSFDGAAPDPFVMALGRHAFEAGPDVTAVERWGLADPLLARLPAIEMDWRVGHYARALPDGYLDTLASGENRLADPGLARYHELLREVTRGPLLDPRRLRTAVELALGRHDGLLDRLVARYPTLRTVALAPDAGGALRAGPEVVPPVGLRFRLPRAATVESLRLELERGTLPRVELFLEHASVWRTDQDTGDGPRELAPGVRADAVWLRPADGERARLGGVTVVVRDG